MQTIEHETLEYTFWRQLVVMQKWQHKVPGGLQCRRRCLLLMICLTALVLVVNGYLVVEFLAAYLMRGRNQDWQFLKFGKSAHSVEAAREKKVLFEDLFEDLAFDDALCRSRREEKVYRRISRHLPSPNLTSRLKAYASHHARCTRVLSQELRTSRDAYGDAQGWEELFARKLKGSGSGHLGNCQFLIWIRYSGLGNSLVSIASAFLYSLLTNRVLLIDSSSKPSDLFCEPFPGSSWLLPESFPQSWLEVMNQSHPLRLGHLVTPGFRNSVQQNGNSLLRNTTDHVEVLPHAAFIHLTHTSNADDNRFFCEFEQSRLAPIPWLFLRSNQYFVPGLYFVSSFYDQLQTLFPKPDTVSHFLARYLFHPANQVWEVVTRFFDAYIARAELRVGIQLRTFGSIRNSFDYVSRQSLLCAIQNGLLPNVSSSEQRRHLPGRTKEVAVLVTALKGEYHDDLKQFYLQHGTRNGEVVSFHQLTREVHQNSESTRHNMGAWAEIVLLSLSDVLITSSWSTFGYAAQSLAGIQPVVLTKGAEDMPVPVCIPTCSMEPCFHAVPLMNCTPEGQIRDPSNSIPFVRHCEDVAWGVKLFSN